MQHLAEQDELYQEWITALEDRPTRVVLADGDDPRVVEAAAWLAQHTTVQPVLVSSGGDPRELRGHPDVEVITTARLAANEGVHQALRLKSDGTARAADEVASFSEDPLYLATALVATGKCHAGVGGAARSTRDVIRAGLKILGLRDEVSSVSSCFIIVLLDGRRLAYGDCAVIPTPDEHQLADVAMATARTFEQLTGEEPAVAMLSFSTLGSAEHPEVDRVRSATEIVRSRQPHLRIDGELQFDAAVLESVGRSKADGSPVAGRANVLIFPNLAAGNIGYKITERLAGAAAIGPVLQGLRSPFNDLSRGCSSSDIAAVSLVSALQAVAP